MRVRDVNDCGVGMNGDGRSDEDYAIVVNRGNKLERSRW